MKWRTESFEARRARLAQWRPWFAWHPVHAASGDGTVMVWLEVVERRAMAWSWDGYGGVVYEHRVPTR